MSTTERVERALLAVDAVLGRPYAFPGLPDASPGRMEGRAARSPGQLELGLVEFAPARTGEEAEGGPRVPPGGALAAIQRHPRVLRAEAALRSLDGDVWETFEYSLRSCLPVDADAAAFASLALLCGPEAAADRSRREVRSVRGAAFKVRREVHRLLGLLRFAPDPDGVLSAFCEPDHEVLDLLLPAFRRRFGAESFRIVDLRRGRTVGSDRCPGIGVPDSSPPGSEADPDPVELWKTYYRAVENPARLNPRLRLQFMPRRYWKHLPETDA